jgi:hypothetical protein
MAPLFHELVRLWAKFYRLGRQNGLAEELALELATAVVLSGRMKEWLEIYRTSKREGLPDGTAMEVANSAILSIRELRIRMRGPWRVPIFVTARFPSGGA